jgi:uncharacterized damage-inducible protein DinB
VACLLFSTHRTLPVVADERRVGLVDRTVEKNLKPEQTAASKVASLDWKHSLLETFAINERANQKLLESLNEKAWQTAPSGGKGRSLAGIACHIHNVRLMWLAAADKSGKVPAKLEDDKATREEAMQALSKSAALLRKLLEKGLEHPAGRVPNFKPDVVAFVGYLIAHDSHHRGQMAMLARQIGAPLPSKASFGIWEWGTLWKESRLSR